MNGYFSRIAKHSGLRFLEQGGGPRALRTMRASHLPVPIGIEKMVPAPPLDVAETILVSSEREPEGKAQTAEPRMPNARERQQSDPTIRENPQARERQESHLERAGEEARVDPRMPSERENITPPARVEKQSAESPSSGETRIVGQTVFAGAGSPDAHAEDESTTDGDSHLHTDESERVEQAATTRYFTRTAEALERGGLGVAEIQDIVLHEAQEWVAASPARADIQDVGASDRSGNIVTHKIVQTASERGVVTLNDERPRETAERAGTPGLEEASFHLSIGTISVVIEDAVPPLRQAESGRQDQGNRRARQVSERQAPRLSRHYL